MGPTVLLLTLLLHLGISNKSYYRYSGVVTIMDRNGGNKYKLQLCSLNTSICQLVTTDADCDTNENSCQVCKNKTDFVFMSDNANEGERLSSVLASATNCSAITPTISIHTKLVTITTTIKLLAPTPSMDNHPAAMCTNTYTTTVSISNSVAPTEPENKYIAKNCNTCQAALGATVGTLGVLLAIVSISWIGTCWVMKKRSREMNINTTNIRYSKKQATNGNNSMSLHHNQAYGTQPKKETNTSNTDREYEVIPPLMNEETSLNETEVNDDRDNSDIQTSKSTTQPHQQTSPGQSKEEVEHTESRVQLEQLLTGSGEHKNSIGNNSACHTLEPKAEDDDDKAAPYEVPVPTYMKPKNQ